MGRTIAPSWGDQNENASPVSAVGKNRASTNTTPQAREQGSNHIYATRDSGRKCKQNNPLEKHGAGASLWYPCNLCWPGVRSQHKHHTNTPHQHTSHHTPFVSSFHRFIHGSTGLLIGRTTSWQPAMLFPTIIKRFTATAILRLHVYTPTVRRRRSRQDSSPRPQQRHKMNSTVNANRTHAARSKTPQTHTHTHTCQATERK